MSVILFSNLKALAKFIVIKNVFNLCPVKILHYILKLKSINMPNLMQKSWSSVDGYYFFWILEIILPSASLNSNILYNKILAEVLTSI